MEFCDPTIQYDKFGEIFSKLAQLFNNWKIEAVMSIANKAVDT
jgi:hypothetical protein